MATVGQTNAIFAEKGLSIKLPYPENWLVQKIEIVEKRSSPAAVQVLLAVTVCDEAGQTISDLLFQESPLVQEKPSPVMPAVDLAYANLLPQREQFTFTDPAGAVEYLHRAVTHLLQEHGYREKEEIEENIFYLGKGSDGVFIALVPVCDEFANGMAHKLLALRKKHGSDWDYWLIMLAFQDFLGVPLREQEAWLSQQEEFLALHRIGVYAVDNLDPNTIYPFTVYPKALELRKYFMQTSRSWPFVKQRYVENKR